MAFSAIFRRATSAISRYSVESCICFKNGRSLNHTPLSLIFTGEILHHGGERKLPSFLLLARFSSLLSRKQSADAELLQIIKSEIKCSEEERRVTEEIPKGFPFEIQDEEGSNTVTLTRAYLGEKIEAVVSMPRMEEPMNNEDAANREANLAGGDEKISQPTISLTVAVSKAKELKLEFCCTAYADEVVIDSLSVERNHESDDVLAYEGPDFSDLDENLQKAFHKFLEIRGISPATTNYLYEYMINKDEREYSRWLQNLKLFIE